MSLFLRLMCRETVSDADEERLVIEKAFSNSQFVLTKPLEPALRGGFIVYVECSEQEIDKLVDFLEQNGIMAVL